MDNKEQLLEMLRATLHDFRLSRGEKKTIREFVQHYFKGDHELAVLRSDAFDIARNELMSPQSKEVLGWLEELVKVLLPDQKKDAIQNHVVFSSQSDCVRKLQGLISTCRRTLDICVFTITDDRICGELEDAVKRDVQLRIISDDEKASDLGSDIYRLRAKGIPVRTDRDPNHMHHKFAIFDDERVLNGSYNWTRSASNRNEENFVVSNDPILTREFRTHFERLWEKFA